MKIAVIGLGSMGKRRIRLLQSGFQGHAVFGVDHNEERRRQAGEEYGIFTAGSLEELLAAEKPECAFVCTSPLSHAAVIHDCLENGMHVFTEINLVSDGYEENRRLAREKGLTLFLSSTMLYREELKEVAARTRAYEGRLSYTYHVGQYLPDWHPWESYESFFIGDKRTNGCRELLAIELPWMIRAFGEIAGVTCQKNRLTGLNIDYDDCCMLLLRHQNGNTGMLMVDVAAREAVRRLTVIGENLYLEWGGKPGTLLWKNLESAELERLDGGREAEQLSGYNATIVENAYRDEIAQFFGELEGTRQSFYGFREDLETLKLIDRIEQE